MTEVPIIYKPVLVWFLYDRDLRHERVTIVGSAPPSFKGGFNFFKIDGNEEVWKIFLEKGGKTKWGVCLQLGHFYIESFLEIPHDAE